MRLDDARALVTDAGGTPPAGAQLKIIHCFRAPVGGLFRHVRDLAEAQANAGHSVGIVCDASPGTPFAEGAIAAMTPALALGLRRVPMRRELAPSDVTTAWRLRKEIRSLDPDVLHGHGAKGGAYARAIGTLLRASGSRVARIYTPHGGSLHYERRSLAGRIYFPAERILARMTDAFIFVSRYEADTYAAKVGRTRKPVSVVVNGLSREEFVPVTPAGDARDFLFIGELRDLKGPDVFIEALARIRERTGEAPTAVMVGPGDGRPRYEMMVASLGLTNRVEFRDPMPARDAFALARTVVVPSRAESMPYVVLEAIGAGVPLIATRVGGIPEIFGDAASALVSPGAPLALAVAMSAAVADPAAAQEAAARLRTRAEDTFTIDAMVGGIAGAYTAALR